MYRRSDQNGRAIPPPGWSPDAEPTGLLLLLPTRCSVLDLSEWSCDHHPLLMVTGQPFDALHMDVRNDHVLATRQIRKENGLIKADPPSQSLALRP